MFIVSIASIADFFLLKYSDVNNFRKHKKVLVEQIRCCAIVRDAGNGMLT